MKRILLVAGILLAGCASQKGAVGQGDTRTIPVEHLDDYTYLLVESSNESSYGYDQKNPVKVGGSNENSGPINERKYLNALLGPNGEPVKYFRAGSCCPFKTPNGLFENTGMLDRYRVFWEGGKDTLDIYINMYDKGDLKIPNGFTARKKM